MKTTENYMLLQTKQLNKPTVQVIKSNKKILLYSKYNPIRDSRAFAEETYDINTENYFIYGLGLGYHINELEDILIKQDKNYHIYVIECNKDIIKIGKENLNLSRILRNPKISFINMENKKESYDKIAKILEIDNIKIGIHKPSLNIIPEEFIQLKYLLEEFMMKESTIDGYSNLLDENFQENIKNFQSNVDVLFNKFENKPLFLVAAGPSLDKNIHQLSRVKDKGLILSVGRAVRSLLAANIIPDYIIITDPSEFLYDMQLKGLDIDVPIIVLSTCDKNVMLKYKGLKYIALQKGYENAEKHAKENDNLVVNTGGSVATTGLDIAIKMGCNPIIFVGQDLAFTDNKTHSKDTFSKEIIKSNTLRKVEDIDGNTIETSKNLYIYLRWIQNRIKEENHIDFIDATEGGARIKGTRIMKLSEVVDEVWTNG